MLFVVIGCQNDEEGDPLKSLQNVSGGMPIALGQDLQLANVQGFPQLLQYLVPVESICTPLNICLRVLRV